MLTVFVVMDQETEYKLAVEAVVKHPVRVEEENAK